MFEDYRIEPFAAYDRRCDGVFVNTTGAWLGRVCRVRHRDGQWHTVVIPILDFGGQYVRAPDRWADRVVERLQAMPGGSRTPDT